MRLLPAWLIGGNDRELARTRYAGKQSASARARTKQRGRDSMGQPHRNARDADRAGQAWDVADRRRFGS